MIAMLQDKTAILFRITCLSALLMAPMLGMMASRAAPEAGVSHGVGLALLVTLQRTSTF